MQLVLFCSCAFLFSLGDYLCSIDSFQFGNSQFSNFQFSRTLPMLAGALVGACGYFVFAYLSRATPLAALAGYINGAVVIITCVFFGAYLSGNRLSTAEWFWIAVIFCGIAGLAYSRTSETLS